MEGRYHEIHRMLKSKKDDDKKDLNHELVSDLRVFWWSIPDDWQQVISDCEAFLQEKRRYSINMDEVREISGGLAEAILREPQRALRVL